MANRSEVMKAAWRKRKRSPGKGTCYFCKKKIFAGGVVIKGHKFHKGCGESWGAGLKPAQVGKNPGTNWHVDRGTDLLVQRTAAIKRGDKEEAGKLRAKIGENIHAAEASRRRGMNPSGNFTDAWIDVKGLIDWHYPYPSYQGVTDVTEHIELARIADEHNLTDKQYDNLIDKAQKYYDKIAKNPRRKISKRKRAPRDAFRYFGAEELNPKFRFGPTGFRPPAKWFSKMAQGTSASHFGRKLKELTASQRAKVGQIVGGIWAKYTDATRFEILRKYEPAAVRALANPSLGKRVQMLNCPACRGLNPVSRLNVYLRCSTCGAQLRSVRVRHKH